jgi:hypothetical protein
MSFLLAVIKLAALAAALICLSAIGPGVQPAGAERHALLPSGTSPSAVQMQCRIYFGCVPVQRDRSSDVRQ